MFSSTLFVVYFVHLTEPWTRVGTQQRLLTCWTHGVITVQGAASHGDAQLRAQVWGGRWVWASIEKPRLGLAVR